MAVAGGGRALGAGQCYSAAGLAVPPRAPAGRRAPVRVAIPKWKTDCLRCSLRAAEKHRPSKSSSLVH